MSGRIKRAYRASSVDCDVSCGKTKTKKGRSGHTLTRPCRPATAAGMKPSYRGKNGAISLGRARNGAFRMKSADFLARRRPSVHSTPARCLFSACFPPVQMPRPPRRARQPPTRSRKPDKGSAKAHGQIRIFSQEVRTKWPTNALHAAGPVALPGGSARRVAKRYESHFTRDIEADRQELPPPGTPSRSAPGHGGWPKNCLGGRASSP